VTVTVSFRIAQGAVRAVIDQQRLLVPVREGSVFGRSGIPDPFCARALPALDS
jgi:hypothetical protein